MYRRQAFFTMRILWGALLASVAIYAAILAFNLIPHQDAPNAPEMLYAFAPLALVLSVMSFMLPMRLHQQAVMHAKLKINEESIVDESFSAAYREAPPSKIQKIFADTNAAERAAVAAFMSPFVISLALSEAVVLFGFLLGFLGFDAKAFIPFFVLGTILMLLRFPTDKAVFSSFERIRGAVFSPGPPNK